MAAPGPKLVAANWKMNGLRQDGEALAAALVARRAARGVGADIVLCPPFTLLMTVGRVLAGSAVGLGAQDCHAEPAGAFTGDIAAPMLRDLGCGWVILGHSERRAGHAETDALVRAKALAALAHGLVPIVCVGETEAQRLAGQAEAVVEAQIAGSVPEASPGAPIVVAYEPIWAIGTGRVPSDADIVAMHAVIRTALDRRIPGGGAMRILYGGSVKPSNARQVLHLEGVDGALVGGASLEAGTFWPIVEAAG